MSNGILVASCRLEQRLELRAALEFEARRVTDVTTAAEAVERSHAEHYGFIVWDENVGTTASDSLELGGR